MSRTYRTITMTAREASLRELRTEMRHAALRWRYTPARQRRRRAEHRARAIYFRETARILAATPAGA